MREHAGRSLFGAGLQQPNLSADWDIFLRDFTRQHDRCATEPASVRRLSVYELDRRDVGIQNPIRRYSELNPISWPNPWRRVSSGGENAASSLNIEYILNLKEKCHRLVLMLGVAEEAT
jgi:hypothetical protein